MKTRLNRRNAGFTLVEMIGVIAIIGILAAVLVPKVMQAVARSKVSGTAVAYNTLKTAVMDYYSRSNSFPVRSGTAAVNTATATGRFDADLLSGGFIEKLVSTPIGSTLTTGALTTRVHVRSLAAAANGNVAVTATVGGNNYNMDSNTATADFSTGQIVVSLVIPGVTLTDAIQLNALVDNVSNTASTADVVGRCMYSAPAANGTVTCYLYLAHQ